MLASIGLPIDVGAKLGGLRTSEQQLVEIARALTLKARVLIMDEPTAALSQREVERLFEVVATLRRQGVAMMFVGHRMDEIFRIADRIAVLRDGRLVGVEPAAALSRDRAIAMMVGRELSALYPHREAAPGEVLLEVEGLTRAGEFRDVGFTVRRGEIVGLGGLVGSGRTEVARALFGITRPTRRHDPPRRRRAPLRQRRRGDGGRGRLRLRGPARPEPGDGLSDRRERGADGARRDDHRGLLQPAQGDRAGRAVLERLKLRFQSYAQPVSALSGGNQQKVVLAKWLATAPSLLILDEPTQGIDVQSKAEVHGMISDLAARAWRSSSSRRRCPSSSACATGSSCCTRG